MHKNLVEKMKSDFEELKQLGYIPGTRELIQATGKKFNYKKFAHYFNGDFNSDFVMVQLNPKDDEDAEEDKVFETYEDYFRFYAKYGKITYVENDKDFFSLMDENQFYFTKAFNVFPYIEDKDKRKSEEHKKNLAMALDMKLQLELIPYGSKDFNGVNFEKTDIGKEQIERILEVITERDRKYIFFCGEIFNTLLQEYIVENKKHDITLLKKNNEPAKKTYRCHIITLKYNNKLVKAAIADSFADKSVTYSLMYKYGEACRKCYEGK